MLRAPIRLGLQIPNFNFPGVSESGLIERLSEIATTAESSGIDTVLVMDHLHQIRGVGPPENWMLEGNTILGAIAARTERVNLSLLVGAVPYRNPALFAKVTTTLDVISGGRAIHGIGAAWNEEEATAYGYDFPPLRVRFEMLEDASNFFCDADRLRHLVGVLEVHCERLDRDPAEITKTRLGTVVIAPTHEEAERKLDAL